MDENGKIVEIEIFLRKYQSWANVTFDQKFGESEGSLNHLLEEVGEIQDAIVDGDKEGILEEHADGMFLLMNSLMLQGFSFLDVINLMEKKFHFDLIYREWQPKNEKGYFKHVKTATEKTKQVIDLGNGRWESKEEQENFIAMNKEMMLMEAKHWWGIPQDYVPEDPKENWKLAKIRLPGKDSDDICYVDRLTLKAYEIVGMYEKGNVEITDFKFVRWATGFDV